MDRLERGYFSKYAAVHAKGGENKYLKLFQALCQSESSDEQLLRMKLKDEAFLSYLPTAKNHLYHTILRTMRNYSAEVLPELCAREYLSDAYYLGSKGLRIPQMKALQRSRQVAEETDHVLLLMETWTQEIDWHMDDLFEHNGSVTHIEQAFRDMNKAWERFRNKMEMQKIFARLLLFQQQIGMATSDDDRKKLNQLFDHETLGDETFCVSQHAKILWNLCWALRGRLTTDFAQTQKHLLRAWHLINGKKDRVAEFYRYYPMVLEWYIEACIRTDKKKEALQVLFVLGKLKSQYSAYAPLNWQVRIAATVYRLEMFLHRNSGDGSKAMGVLRLVQGESDGFWNALPMHLKLMLFLEMSLVCYESNDFAKASYWLNRVYAHKFEKMDREFCSFCRLYYLLLQVSEGEYDHLYYAYRSVSKAMERDGQVRDFEKTMLRFCKTHIAKNRKLEPRFDKTMLLHDIIFFRDQALVSGAFLFLDFKRWFDQQSKIGRLIPKWKEPALKKIILRSPAIQEVRVTR